MLKHSIPMVVGAVLAGAAFAFTPSQPPEMPKPQKEHEWFKQLEGEWTTTGEMQMDANTPPVKSKGTESARMLGGFWMISTLKGEMMGIQFESLFTIGYDPEKKKYVGTWVDNMMPHMWKYEGELDETGKTLTLHTTGPCPKGSGKMRKFKEQMTIKDKDTRSFSSSMEEDDGKWTTFVRMESKRKK
jgi:hypothetical protein